MRPGAPLLHERAAERILNPARNILLEIDGQVGEIEKGFAVADVIHEGSYEAHRVQHAHLKTHCSITWLDKNRRLNVRTSSQTPHITNRSCASSLICFRPRSGFLRTRGRRLWRQAGSIDRRHCAFATLKTGRPVKLEFTREEAFIAATTRIPMNVHLKIGARRDGTLTASPDPRRSNTGAYGNHGGETLYAACGEAVAVYRLLRTRKSTVTPYNQHGSRLARFAVTE